MTNPYSPNQDSTNTDVSAAPQAQYSAAPQAQYTPTPQQAAYGYQQTNEESLLNGNSTKAWVVNLLLEGFLGLIWWIVILVSSEQSQSRKNYVKARIIVTVIFVVLIFILFAAFGAALMSNPQDTHPATM